MGKKSKRNWVKRVFGLLSEEATTISLDNYSYSLTNKNDFKVLWNLVKNDESFIKDLEVISLKRNDSQTSDSIFMERLSSSEVIPQNQPFKEITKYKEFLLAD